MLFCDKLDFSGNLRAASTFQLDLRIRECSAILKSG